MLPAYSEGSTLKVKATFVCGAYSIVLLLFTMFFTSQVFGRYYLGLGLFDENSMLFNLVTKRDARLEASLERTIKLAQKEILPPGSFAPPSIRRVQYPFDICIGGLASRRRNWIFVSGWSARFLDDDNLDVMIAHEIGHKVDDVLGWEVENHERFADGVAKAIYPERFQKYADVYRGKYSFIPWLKALVRL